MSKKSIRNDSSYEKETGYDFREFSPQQPGCSIKGCDEPFDYRFGGGRTDRWKRNPDPLRDPVFFDIEMEMGIKSHSHRSMKLHCQPLKLLNAE